MNTTELTYAPKTLDDLIEETEAIAGTFEDDGNPNFTEEEVIAAEQTAQEYDNARLEEMNTPRRSNGRFVPLPRPTNGLTLKCAKCDSTKDYLRKFDGGIDFPPRLVCTNNKCEDGVK